MITAVVSVAVVCLGHLEPIIVEGRPGPKVEGMVADRSLEHNGAQHARGPHMHLFHLHQPQLKPLAGSRAVADQPATITPGTTSLFKI